MSADKIFSGSAWIIVEEYEPLDHDDTLTNVLAQWYVSETEALEALHAIARDLLVDLEGHERKFLAPPEDGIFRDTYYIMELDRG
jgi:hypothetical protein